VPPADATVDDADGVIPVLRQAADAIRRVLAGVDDWGLAGTRAGQHHSDLAADRACVELLTGAGFGVLSEESGRHHPDRAVTVVVDPLDGSTNAWRGVPWYAASLCAVDDDGPLAALVENLPTGTRYEAIRGSGARRDGVSIAPSGASGLGRSLVALSGYPSRHLGWNQYRALGAAALDLCAVADGTVDAFVDCSVDALGPWDYLGGLLVCQEAGASVADAMGRDLVVLDHHARRTPVAAATEQLLAETLHARRPPA
jgi:myo-inositol-1(or 4)-monophosphatase